MAASALANIRRFDQLVKYLRDELDWPLQSTDFEDLTFDFTPEELGIDSKNAAKIQEIKRLRPLSPNQPWGVFFVKFEPKRLPIVALRRILNSVVLKRRASANRAERKAWEAEDLLFISNYGGDGDGRQITFAHFSQDPTRHDLPTLKVLGWDSLDTPLHIDHVAETLREHLRWPRDEQNAQAWRADWGQAFDLRYQEVVTTSRALASRLAELARAIRNRISTALEIETEGGPLTTLMRAFTEALVHDLDADGFADMYAQTIAYGLLSARIANPKATAAADLALQMPVTNPFLRELMETFLQAGGRHAEGASRANLDFDELGVLEVMELLDHANMEAVIRDFGDRNPQEDPVIHFYELFLKEYDAKRRMQRGVFYTPRPVVSFIVRSLHELLQSAFGLQDGFADTATWSDMCERGDSLEMPEGVGGAEPFITVLDPAVGTGTFLVEIIDVIHRTLTEKWSDAGHDARTILDLWNDYVPAHLLPRLHGYELLMAPYAIAHLKVGLKLRETGYRFESAERARIYLTNALEQPQTFSGQLQIAMPALAHEGQAVNAVKLNQRFTVLVGNPPYSTSMGEQKWLLNLLSEWKEGLNETKSDLNREEWKFLRFDQHLVSASGAGILGLIINRDFLDGVTKRRMREHLGQSFPLRVVVDLNGDVKGNIADENVFDIEQGVAIVLMSTRPESPRLRFCSLVGTRAEKYVQLLSKSLISGALGDVQAEAPYFRWQPPQAGRAEGAHDEYQAGYPIQDAFKVKSSGIQTKNDAVCIGWTEDEIFARVQWLNSETESDASSELRATPDGAWTVRAAQEDLRRFGVARANVHRILYRPFDWRFVYYTRRSGGFLGRPRYEVMRHMLEGTNVGMVFNRQVVGQTVSQFGVSRDLICHGTFYLGNKGQDYLAPLYLNGDDLLASADSGRRSNFTEAFTAEIERRIGTESAIPAEVVFSYIYAVFHSPTYRSRYGEFLKMDFPRVPLTSSLELLQGLAELGDELIALHLVESPTQRAVNARHDPVAQAWRFELAEGLRPPIAVSFNGPEDATVAGVEWSKDTVWIDARRPTKGDTARVSGTVGFSGIPEDIWIFRFGGYQICEKWLKDRKGRTLGPHDLVAYYQMVIGLHETIRIMREIDELIDGYGGWPTAFSVGDIVPFERQSHSYSESADAGELMVAEAADAPD